MKKEKHLLKEGFTPLTVFMLVVLLLYCISLILLLMWGILATFKDGWDLEKNVLGLPNPFVWNYSIIFKSFLVPIENNLQVGLFGMIINSLLYCLGCTFTNTIVTCITAYMCARYDFKFSKIVYNMVIVTMILPIIGSLPSEMDVVQSFNFDDNIIGMWIMKASFLGMYFLVFYNVFKTMPMAYTEAAKIDGANNFQVMVLIILPLVKTLFFTVCLINFIGYWNDYQTPLLFMPNKPTLSYGVYMMSQSNIKELSSAPMRLGSAVIMLIPMLVVFLTLHKRLLGNLTMGGIKG